jgi:hypothetical protein
VTAEDGNFAILRRLDKNTVHRVRRFRWAGEDILGLRMLDGTLHLARFTGSA